MEESIQKPSNEHVEYLCQQIKQSTGTYLQNSELKV